MHVYVSQKAGTKKFIIAQFQTGSSLNSINKIMDTHDFHKHNDEEKSPNTKSHSINSLM